METQLPDAYALLLARILTLEAELEALRDEIAELRGQISEAQYGG